MKSNTERKKGTDLFIRSPLPAVSKVSIYIKSELFRSDKKVPVTALLFFCGTNGLNHF
jgi:hypothetical protein